MQKNKFYCDNCEVRGLVRLADEYDEYKIEFCPCCGEPLLEEFEDDGDE